MTISTLHVKDKRDGGHTARWVVRYRDVLPLNVERLVKRLEKLGWDRETTINVDADDA